MTATVDLRLCGSMDHLRLLWQVGETLLESVPFEDDPEGTRYNVLLAVQEMLTNILRHAYGKDETKPIEVRMEACATDFTVELRDHGPRFDPLAHETPAEDPMASPPNTDSGGYGIMIAKMVMDSVTYAWKDGCNVLAMKKDVDLPVVAAGRGQREREG
ncbi:MAG: ATP-binding protein [Planctomycetota bacterium]|jgi:anti-sigma regulatory factor (Ser/Thr protein kinase)